MWQIIPYSIPIPHLSSINCILLQDGSIRKALGRRRQGCFNMMKLGNSLSCSAILLYASLPVQVSRGPTAASHARCPQFASGALVRPFPSSPCNKDTHKPHHLHSFLISESYSKPPSCFLFWFKTKPKETLYKLVPSDTPLNCTSCLTPHLKASLCLWLTKHHPSISLHSLSFQHTVKPGRLFASKYSPHKGTAWEPQTCYSPSF